MSKGKPQGSRFRSVDQLQNFLAESVFSYTKDRKKASGRALGTLVEVITFYLLKSWRLLPYTAIERQLPEFSNEEITHNVEYSLHPSIEMAKLNLSARKLPISSAVILKSLMREKVDLAGTKGKQNQLLTTQGVLRNACTVSEGTDWFFVATLDNMNTHRARVSVHRLYVRPFAIAECKRVGIEEGVRKGPQTIEKAKQGAYVARSVSSLQKVRMQTGEIYGAFPAAGGELLCKNYDDFVHEIIDGNNAQYLRNFILTVGVVSNHGNWFTSDNHNKELKVLAQSYDWLLFLTDNGLGDFIRNLIIEPSEAYKPIRAAFLASYTGTSGANQFTKVKIGLTADRLLSSYFANHLATVESWFNVISPHAAKLNLLHGQLKKLAAKNWLEIHS